MQRLNTSASGVLERVYREASRPAQRANLQNLHRYTYMNKTLVPTVLLLGLPVVARV